MNVVVVTPERTALREDTDFVALPLFDGEIGIAKGRSPMVGRLGYGEMRIRVGGQPLRFYLDGGFVQVSGDEISVLTNRAVPAEELDPAVAQELLDSAIARRADTPELFEIRQRAIDQARAQLRVARRAR